MWIAGFALFVLGIILIIIVPINKKKNERCSEQTQGILKDIWKGDSSEGGGIDTYVYLYLVNGIEYQTKSTIHSAEANEIGDSCTIWYNPKKPKDAQPFRYESTKIYSIFLVIGVAMILLGIFLTCFSFAK